ncbi:MAG: MtrB/PioB family outer membrane beta-barrel protein [Deltaproteobacteria bacterium]|nr:MtrB/PioB family outer membrane beta-barrel protein [Deltaproteobacteria bacterium]
MKKGLLVLVGACFLIFTVCGGALGWQGRMDGMGDPVGLVGDESDFLVHPAKAAHGKGVKIYSHYGFKYTDVDWDWEADLDGGLVPAILGALSLSYDLENDGDEWWHEALLGLTFPMGPGRMGVFFEFEGEYGDYGGHGVLTGGVGGLGSATLDMKNDVDTDMNDFALRLVYGVPMGKVNLGMEAKLAYREEENSWDSSLDSLSVTGAVLPTISIDSTNFPITGLNRLLLPYDSDYWEFSFKTGVNWSIGSVEFDLTPRVGFIFGGDNSWDSDLTVDVGAVRRVFPGATATNDFDMDGDVDGWNLGLDFWLRFPVTNDVSMPFLFRVDYREKERDGSGDGMFDITIGGASIVGGGVPTTWDYEMEEETLEITAGGGLDINVSKQTKIAFGLFYSYINSETNLETDLGINTPAGGINLITETDDGYPEYTEHQVRLEFAGEHAISSTFQLRGGLHLFYGWVDQEYDIDGGANILGAALPAVLNNTIELDGDHWGIDLSVGVSVMFDGFVVEPFINGGYHELSLDGDEEWNALGAQLLTFDVDTERSEWFIGAGFSLLFNL